MECCAKPGPQPHRRARAAFAGLNVAAVVLLMARSCCVSHSSPVDEYDDKHVALAGPDIIFYPFRGIIPNIRIFRVRLEYGGYCAQNGV